MIFTLIFVILAIGVKLLGFKERMKEGFKQEIEKAEARRQEKLNEKQYQKDRLKQLKRDHVPFCPRCHSTNITFVKKGISLGRTAVGGAVGSLFNPVASAAGAVLGGLTGGKGKVKCLNCGKEWKP